MNVMLIDIDGTITNEDIKNEVSHLYPTATPTEGSVEQINKWYDEGNHITFFTARENKDKEITEAWLKEHGFKYHGLIMDKPRCLNNDDRYVWIDNRKVMGVTYKGIWSELTPKSKIVNIFEED